MEQNNSRNTQLKKKLIAETQLKNNFLILNKIIFLINTIIKNIQTDKKLKT